MVTKRRGNKGNEVQAGRRGRAREERKARGRPVRYPPDDGIGAFPPISDETPGQEESRAAFDKFNTGRGKCPWWLEYLELRAEGWDWRKAALIAWMSSPAGKRWPKTQQELAQKVLGLQSDRVLRKWREDDPEIDERIARLQVEPLFEHRRDVIEALVKVAKTPNHLAHQDRELFLKMTGDYKPVGRVESGGSLGETEFDDATEHDLGAIAGALRKEAEGGSPE